MQEGDVRLTSPAFDDGEEIPDEYGYDAENVNPSLEIDNVSDDAESLVFVMDDPDAVEPAGQIWVHWLVWNVPPETSTIPEDWDSDEAVEGKNDFDEIGYGGPSPPDEPHTYRFKLYALDAVLDLEEGATVDDLGEAMDERVVARTQLTGTYAP
nr:YbhB/YbcL family Raf kinase inhibitor-like protein [Natronorubrum sediminis]